MRHSFTRSLMILTIHIFLSLVWSCVANTFREGEFIATARKSQFHGVRAVPAQPDAMHSAHLAYFLVLLCVLR